MFSKLQDDLDVHSWAEFEQGVRETAMEIKEKLMHCPYFTKAVELLKRLKTIADAKKTTDLDAEGWKQWWIKNNFQNPFEGMDMEEMDPTMLI
jgi:hypothetical protein